MQFFLDRAATMIDDDDDIGSTCMCPAVSPSVTYHFLLRAYTLPRAQAGGGIQLTHATLKP
jgi:hypothetical protein